MPEPEKESCYVCEVEFSYDENGYINEPYIKKKSEEQKRHPHCVPE